MTVLALLLTVLALLLAAACAYLGFLLVGAYHLIDDLRTRLDRRDAEVEDLANEFRHAARGHHPAGRALRVVSDTPLYDEAAVAALREALEQRGDEYPWGTA